MTTDITSPKWRGERAAAIDPASVRFTAAPAPSECSRCIFSSQRAQVCEGAHSIAKKHGLPLCGDGDGYIYILDESDPRQLPLVEVAQ